MYVVGFIFEFKRIGCRSHANETGMWTLEDNYLGKSVV